MTPGLEARQISARLHRARWVDWKDDLQGYGAGRESRKPRTPVVGIKPYRKCQFKLKVGKVQGEGLNGRRFFHTVPHRF